MAAELAGITFRQLDYWTRQEIIPRQTGGSGTRRVWSSAEVVLMMLAGEVSASSGASTLDHVRSGRDWLLEEIAAGTLVVAWMGHEWHRLDGDPGSFVDHVVEFGLASVTVFNLDAMRRLVGERAVELGGSRLGLAAS